MRVMHVIDSLDRGGAERMLVDLANQAVADGYQVSCCITRQGTALAADLRPDVELTVMDRHRRLDVGALVRFGRLVRSGRIDVLHAHSRSTMSFLAAARALRRLDAPVVFHDHYGPIERDSAVPLWFRLWGRRYVALYVGVSSRLGEWARAAGIPSSRIRIIPNALDLARLEGACGPPLRDLLGVDTDTHIGIVVAGLRRDKGLDLLIEAAAAQEPGGPPFILAFVGKEQDPSYVAQCRARIEALGQSARIRLLGEREDVPSLLRSADFAVIPSRSESGPLVLIEHLVAGLPVVATTTGEMARRMAAAGLPGLVPAGDASAIATALRDLLALGQEARARRGAEGRELAARLFDIRHRMPQWYEVYEFARAQGAR